MNYYTLKYVCPKCKKKHKEVRKGENPFRIICLCGFNEYLHNTHNFKFKLSTWKELKSLIHQYNQDLNHYARSGDNDVVADYEEKINHIQQHIEKNWK